MARFLGRFNYVLENKCGKTNLVADALNRKGELATITQAQGEILNLICEGMENYPLARNLVNMAKEGKTKRFWEDDEFLYTTRGRIYVSKWKNVGRSLIKECHNSL